MHYPAFGWLGLMAGIAGLMQAHYAQEIVPNALNGRELDVLAAVVLGGARLGGGRGTVLGVILGIILVAVTQTGLNLLGISTYAFRHHQLVERRSRSRAIKVCRDHDLIHVPLVASRRQPAPDLVGKHLPGTSAPIGARFHS